VTARSTNCQTCVVHGMPLDVLRHIAPACHCPSAGAEFETIQAPLEDPMPGQYAAAAAAWNRLFREFLYAEEQAAAAAGEAGAAPSGGAHGRGFLAHGAMEHGWH
jgi:hypothetical protein